MIRYHSMFGCRWRPLELSTPEITERASLRLDRILRSWEDTPYAAGQGHRQVGGDCVRATVSIISEWLRCKMPELATLPPDASLHDRTGAIRGLHRIRRSLPPHKRLRGLLEAQPGDVLITGPVGGGPGHAVIVGPQRNTLWQATRSAGFVRCGWSLPVDFSRLFAVMRFQDRDAAGR